MTTHHFYRYQQAAAREDSAGRGHRDPESAAGGREECPGTLRWLKSGEKFQADPAEKHQLIYLMEGSGQIRLENKDYDVGRGAGVYLGPSETATIQAGGVLR